MILLTKIKASEQMENLTVKLCLEGFVGQHLGRPGNRGEEIIFFAQEHWFGTSKETPRSSRGMQRLKPAIRKIKTVYSTWKQSVKTSTVRTMECRDLEMSWLMEGGASSSLGGHTFFSCTLYVSLHLSLMQDSWAPRLGIIHWMLRKGWADKYFPAGKPSFLQE